MKFRSILLSLALLLPLSGAAVCQPQGPEPSTYTAIPSDTLILQWLHSPEPRLQAWAAHFILEQSRAALLPALESTLSQILASSNGNADPALIPMLDTTIQLNGTLPLETLEKLDSPPGTLTTQQLILLARLPWTTSGPIWLSSYQPSRQELWLSTRVAAQMLAQQPPPEFAAKLLQTVVVSATIFVHDPNDLSGFGSGRSSCCGGGIGPLTDDWPEAGSYAFQDPPRPPATLPANETLFLAAPDAIYVVREVNRTYTTHVCGGFAPLNNAIRSHLVGTLLRGSPASPFPEQTVTVEIAFHDREAYRAQVAGFVEQQQLHFAEVASTLTARGLMTEPERQAAALRINLTLQDTRTQPAPDLPAIAFRPPVAWVAAH